MKYHMTSVGPQSCGCVLLSTYGLAKSAFRQWPLHTSQTMCFVFLSASHIATSVYDTSDQNFPKFISHRRSFGKALNFHTIFMKPPTLLLNTDWQTDWHFLQHQDFLFCTFDTDNTQKMHNLYFCLLFKKVNKEGKLSQRAAKHAETDKTISQLTLAQDWSDW